ncbi:integral membrane protein, partial [Aureobasidium melanogenum]
LRHFFCRHKEPHSPCCTHDRQQLISENTETFLRRFKYATRTRDNQSDAKPKCSSQCQSHTDRLASLRNSVEYATCNALLARWEHGCNEEIGYSEHAISTHGGSKGGNNARKHDNPVSADAMDKQTNSDIGKSSRHGRGQEAKSSAQRSVTLNILEEEVCILLKSVESSPDTKDIEADAGEAFVLPERVGDECWTSQALLASDPEDESTEEDER